MKKLILILVLIVLLYGCTNNNNRDTIENFRTGTGGLSVSFIPNHPPAKVYVRNGEVNEVSIGINLKNLGAADITGGALVLSGYDPGILAIPSYRVFTASDDLVGKSAFNPQGGFNSFDFNGAVNLPAMGDRYSPNILATACYDYSTFTELSVCIDPDPYLTKPRACTPSNIASSGQGAPIGVSKVNVEPTKGRTIFQIFFKNFGNGDVFSSAYGSARCLPNGGGIDERQELDIIIVRKVKLGNQDITANCKGMGWGSVRLNNGENFIYCTYDTQGTDSYQTVLSVEMGYSYRITTSRSLEIVKLP
jgi:hypothetical protein